LKNKVLFSFLVLVLVMACIFGACAPKSTSGAKTLKIGGSLPMTGPASVAGLAFKQGWDMAVEKINNEGGLKIGADTYKIELIVEDDHASPDASKTAATKLFYQDNVKFALGSLDPVLTAPMYEVAREVGALVIISLLPASEATPDSYLGVGVDNPLIIRIAYAHDDNAVYSIQYLVKNYPNVKTVGMMCLDFPDYRNLDKYFTTIWAPLGLKVGPDYELFPADCMDFTPYVTRELATKPDAIFAYAAAPPHFVSIAKTAREMGFNGPMVFGPPLDPVYAAQAAPNLSDIIAPGFAMDATNLPDAVKDVIALGRAKYGDALVQDAILAYDNFMLLAQTLEKAKSIDPQTVLKTFETLTSPGDLKSIYGKAYVGGMKTTGVNRIAIRPIPLSRVVNGKGEFIGLFP
jgi:branched-chain amino acid transport system substrate-binding protein